MLDTWKKGPSGYDGEHYSFPPVRTYPLPQRPANEILLYGVGGTTPVEETIRRGLPLALSQPFGPVTKTAESFEKYIAALHASTLREEEIERLLDRAFVLVYALVAPTAQEAQDISKAPYEWHNARLTALRTPVPPSSEWRQHYYDDVAEPAVIDDADWAERTSSSLLSPTRRRWPTTWRCCAMPVSAMSCRGWESAVSTSSTCCAPCAYSPSM